MDVDRARVAGVLISPDVVQQLLPREHLIRMRGEKVEQPELLRRHLDRLPHVENLIVREADLEILVAHGAVLLFRGLRCLRNAEAPQDRLHARHELL